MNIKIISSLSLVIILIIVGFVFWSLKHIIFIDPIEKKLKEGENIITTPLIYGGPYVLAFNEREISQKQTTHYKVSCSIITDKEIFKFDGTYNPSENGYNYPVFYFMFKELYQVATIKIFLHSYNEGPPIYLSFMPGK